MKPEQLTQAFERAASELGVKVRYEALSPSGVSTGGGLCKVRGEWWVMIDKKTPPADRAVILADALARFDTETPDLPPQAQEMLALRRSGGRPPPRTGNA
jgi:hypothetical protein